MDGRVQQPVIDFMKKMFDADYVDMITEPGPIKFLSENSDEAILESLKTRLGVSFNAHGSRVLAIIGHHGCAGNPVKREVQLEQIDKAVEMVKSWNFQMEFVRLYVNSNWEIEEL
jgi:hypothetical protein